MRQGQFASQPDSSAYLPAAPSLVESNDRAMRPLRRPATVSRGVSDLHGPFVSPLALPSPAWLHISARMRGLRPPERGITATWNSTRACRSPGDTCRHDCFLAARTRSFSHGYGPDPTFV